MQLTYSTVKLAKISKTITKFLTFCDVKQIVFGFKIVWAPPI